MRYEAYDVSRKNAFKRVQGSPAGERGVPRYYLVWPLLEEGLGWLTQILNFHFF
jgi:hypothetical protein